MFQHPLPPMSPRTTCFSLSILLHSIRLSDVHYIYYLIVVVSWVIKGLHINTHASRVGGNFGGVFITSAFCPEYCWRECDSRMIYASCLFARAYRGNNTIRGALGNKTPRAQLSWELTIILSATTGRERVECENTLLALATITQGIYLAYIVIHTHLALWPNGGEVISLSRWRIARADLRLANLQWWVCRDDQRERERAD